MEEPKTSHVRSLLPNESVHTNEKNHKGTYNGCVEAVCTHPPRQKQQSYHGERVLPSLHQTTAVARAPIADAGVD